METKYRSFVSQSRDLQRINSTLAKEILNDCGRDHRSFYICAEYCKTFVAHAALKST